MKNNQWLLLNLEAVHCEICFQGPWSWGCNNRWHPDEVCQSGLRKDKNAEFPTPFIQWGDSIWWQVPLRLIAGWFSFMCHMFICDFSICVWVSVPCALCVTCFFSALDTKIAQSSELRKPPHHWLKNLDWQQCRCYFDTVDTRQPVRNLKTGATQSLFGNLCSWLDETCPICSSQDVTVLNETALIIFTALHSIQSNQIKWKCVVIQIF